MERPKHSFGWKRILCIAAAVILLAAAAFGIKALIDSNTDSTTAEAGSRTKNIKKPKAPDNTPEGEISSEDLRFNIFLSSVVRGNIENTATDLDEDEELVRFAFTYRKYYLPDSVFEKEDGDGVSCRTLTLEQVNETLTYFFGKTIDPDREDYSIPTGGDESFNCVFKDGTFWNVPPYPAEEFDFPLRFALTDGFDEENCTVHFRLYKINPYAWGEGDAERHVPLVPMLSIQNAENGNDETKRWITKIGEGSAVFSDFGEELKLVELTTTLY